VGKSLETHTRNTPTTLSGAAVSIPNESGCLVLHAVRIICMQCVICSGEIRADKRGPRSPYCSRDCGEKARTIAKRRGPFQKTCLLCQTRFVSKQSHARYCSQNCYKSSNATRAQDRWKRLNPRPAKYVYTCDFCATEIVRDSPLGGYRRYHAECSVEAKRARYRKKTVRRQTKTTQPSGVSLMQIVERDGWTCWLCKEPVDSGLPRTSRMGATVDHVVPLSKGGSDELDNLRLAHWICNNKKSDKLVDNA
jgi:5-methylcytosine-specific restriction endonuclease McrA